MFVYTQLCRRIPTYPRKIQLIETLYAHKIPISRAVWLLKVTFKNEMGPQVKRAQLFATSSVSKYINDNNNTHGSNNATNNNHNTNMNMRNNFGSNNALNNNSRVHTNASSLFNNNNNTNYNSLNSNSNNSNNSNFGSLYQAIANQNKLLLDPISDYTDALLQYMQTQLKLCTQNSNNNSDNNDNAKNKLLYCFRLLSVQYKELIVNQDKVYIPAYTLYINLHIHIYIYMHLALFVVYVSFMLNMNFRIMFLYGYIHVYLHVLIYVYVYIRLGSYVDVAHDEAKQWQRIMHYVTVYTAISRRI